MPAHLEELYSRSAIEARLNQLAPLLDAWALAAEQATGRPLLVVCLLRGGVFFFSDLLLRMRRSVEPGFCRAWSYAKAGNAQPEQSARLDWQGLAVAGRDVVLVDNICDSGRTLAAAATQATGEGARLVRSVVLVHRLRADSVHTPTLAGFTYAGTEWLAGYGLRDREALMNSPVVYRLRSAS
ncbi:MAG TPA: phosphoribosyltransferase family protein [Opitutaceae bacterium]